jgi:hypothetical protein
MGPVLRSGLGVLAGVVVGGLLIGGVEMFSSRFYPLPAGTNPSDQQALASHISSLPASAFVWVLAAWMIGTLAGAWVAARIAQRKHLIHGAVIGAVFLALGIANMLAIPHPVWVWVCGIVIFIVAGYAGGRLASPRALTAPSL